MPNLKLGRLPDRTPAKISFQASPDLARALQAYAELYRETYRHPASVSDLVPYMLESFLASDRAFARARKESRAAVGTSREPTASGSGPRSPDLFAGSPSAYEAAASKARQAAGG
ncbi:DUF2274 domain-containing protein [Inquilinus limosus]|uniref:DUF2274 domain-containing protein n=1 Tax=Inquilinus limosus TaxID=171674 RepID=UPI0007E8C02D|nr:DUF2274 domain-containing protein [Inquilinus limosus]